MDHAETSRTPGVTIEWDKNEKQRARNRINQRNYRRRKSEQLKEKGKESQRGKSSSRSPGTPAINVLDTQTDDSERSSQGPGTISPFQYNFPSGISKRDQQQFSDSAMVPSSISDPDDASLRKWMTSTSEVGGQSLDTSDQPVQPLDWQLSSSFGSHSDPLGLASQFQDLSWSRSPHLTSGLPSSPQPNSTSSQGKTTLHLAAENGHAQCVQILLFHGANPNLKDSDGFTPLHIAAQKGHKNVVSILTNTGCEVNATTLSGRTALHLAAENDQYEIVDQLLQAGGDPNLQITNQ